jgi:hypothetical protein
MKYYIFFISIIILSYISTVLNIRSRTNLRSKSKLRNKNKGKFRERSHNLSNKKNGPLSWNVEDGDNSLSDLLNLERHNSYNYINIKDLPKLNRNNRRNLARSENEKSLTFRTVGPEIDSTINRNGIKYSNMIHKENNIKLNPGFYGSSRLTR